MSAKYLAFNLPSCSWLHQIKGKGHSDPVFSALHIPFKTGLNASALSKEQAAAGGWFCCRGNRWEKNFIICFAKQKKGDCTQKLHYILMLESNINNGEQIPWDCFSLATVQFYCNSFACSRITQLVKLE